MCCGTHASQWSSHMSSRHHLLLADICPLLSVCCLSPFACCLLPFAFCLLPFAFCLLPFAFCLLPFAFCLLPFARRWLFACLQGTCTVTHFSKLFKCFADNWKASMKEGSKDTCKPHLLVCNAMNDVGLGLNTVAQYCNHHQKLQQKQRQTQK